MADKDTTTKSTPIASPPVGFQPTPAEKIALASMDAQIAAAVDPLVKSSLERKKAYMIATQWNPSIVDSWAVLRSKVALELNSHPQRQWLALAAVDGVKAGLDALASFGYRFDLCFASPAEFDEWPKMMYSKDGKQMIVNNAEEASALGGDFSTTQPTPIVVAPQSFAATPPPPHLGPNEPWVPKPPVNVSLGVGADGKPVAKQIDG
jgi:hypothetical protein